MLFTASAGNTDEMGCIEMGNNGEERTDILVLVDDEGNEHEFALIDRLQVDLYDYAILVPVRYHEEEDDYIDLEDDAYIFRIEAGEEEDALVEVEDEAEWAKVAELWEERIREHDDMDDNGLS